MLHVDVDFNRLKTEFNATFQELFGGGSADLNLTEPDNPLESGINIIARPPGKKPQNISALSTGEKALTAIAFLFSLLKIKPCPFVLLDELDAPLDDANVEKVIKHIKEFSRISQFIIITHNRKTISMGNSLYGVTMEEPGISKIVSVKVRSGDESLPGGDTPVTTAVDMTAGDTTPENSTDAVSA